MRCMARRFLLIRRPRTHSVNPPKTNQKMNSKRREKEKRPIQDRTHVSGSVAAVVEHPLNAAGLNIAAQRVLYAFFFEIV